MDIGTKIAPKKKSFKRKMKMLKIIKISVLLSVTDAFIKDI